MKTNKIVVNKEEKVANITTTSFMEWKGDYRKEAGMAACIDMLSKNLFNIVYSDEYTIVFKKENGKYHNFNHASYKAMEDAINMFTIGDTFNLELPHLDQIMKALVWAEDREDVENMSFGNLISCITELTIGKAQER